MVAILDCSKNVLHRIIYILQIARWRWNFRYPTTGGNKFCCYWVGAAVVVLSGNPLSHPSDRELRSRGIDRRDSL